MRVHGDVLNMRPLLSPKLDFVFKKLFVSDSGILINLLNAVMKLPKSRRIRSVEVKNPTILPEEITKKFIILDILATDESGCQYEIEMQARRHEDDMTLHIFELPKFEKLLKSGQMSHAMSEWLRFLSHAHQEDETMRMTYKNPAILAFKAHIESRENRNPPFPDFHHCPYIGLIGKDFILAEANLP
jgi:hypothetical protein